MIPFNALGGLITTIIYGKLTTGNWKLRRDTFQLIKRLKLRNIVSWRQKNQLFRSENLIEGNRLLETLQNKELIFIISFHRTGTRSVYRYLKQLELRCIHWPDFESSGIDYQLILHPIAHDPKQCVAALAHLFADYDVFSDVPFPGLFTELAESFPESKFILIQRPPQEWWESVRRHWHLEKRPRILETFEAIQYRLPVNTVITEEDKHSLIEKYVSHTKAVQDYFCDNERLLVMNLDDPNINVTVSKFLGISNTAAFPHMGKGSVLPN